MKNKAFTLIETLIAVTLMTVVLTAVTGLILSTLSANSRNRHDLQATLLAQEALEVLRFMRDSNGLQNYEWDGGSALWGEDFKAGSDPSGKMLYLTTCSSTSSLEPCFQLSPDETMGTVVLKDGFVYERSLKLVSVGSSSATPSVNETEVTATVAWSERGLNRSLQLSTYLTNWK